MGTPQTISFKIGAESLEWWFADPFSSWNLPIWMYIWLEKCKRGGGKVRKKEQRQRERREKIQKTNNYYSYLYFKRLWWLHSPNHSSHLMYQTIRFYVNVKHFTDWCASRSAKSLKMPMRTDCYIWTQKYKGVIFL